MNYFGVVSYNINCNFTNYGSALQSWALCRTIDRLGNGRWKSVLIDYCPDCLSDKDPLNPMKNMWDTDEVSRKMCELSLPAIRENFKKFDRFYSKCFCRSKKKYTSADFDNVVQDEGISGFVCGSDTIFCIDEFGFDDGYYANYPCMKEGYSVAYAASFGDSHFSQKDLVTLNGLLENFRFIGLRENTMEGYIKVRISSPVQRVLDPTLLLKKEDYDEIAEPSIETGEYILLYARRYNPAMEEYAERLASEKGWRIIEISLRATNAQRHKVFYEAGVEEFLSLVKHAKFVVTNSYHGAIMSIQYERLFYVFSREQCDTKIAQLLDLLGLTDRMRVSADEAESGEIDYLRVREKLQFEKEKSLDFLARELEAGFEWR